MYRYVDLPNLTWFNLSAPSGQKIRMKPYVKVLSCLLGNIDTKENLALCVFFSCSS